MNEREAVAKLDAAVAEMNELAWTDAKEDDEVLFLTDALRILTTAIERTQPSSAVEHSSAKVPDSEKKADLAAGEPEKAREEVAAIVRDDGVRWLIPLNLPIGTKFYRKVQP